MGDETNVIHNPDVIKAPVGKPHRSVSTTTIDRPKVAVAILLPLPIACPGHPCEMIAVGLPPGGTFTWTVSKGAALVDNAGRSVSTGATLHLVSFQPDDAAGSVPARTADVAVTYTLRTGHAKDKRSVPIHGIQFDVTDTAVTPGTPEPQEVPANGPDHLAGVIIRPKYGRTLLSEPKVTIKLDQTCLRKTDCARNHQVGHLQTVLNTDRRAFYAHSLRHMTLPPSIRDQLFQARVPAPFYDVPKPFSGDGDQQTAHHEDTPAFGADWEDPGTHASMDLKRILYAENFHVWLVVQNIEWAAHHRDTSFVFLLNYKWWLQLNATVDLTQIFDFRVVPDSPPGPAQFDPPTIGKGTVKPNLKDPFADNEWREKVTAFHDLNAAIRATNPRPAHPSGH